MKAYDCYLKTGSGKTLKFHHSSITQRYRNTFWWTCPMIWHLHPPKSSVPILYNVHSFRWFLMFRMPSPILIFKNPKFCNPIKVLFTLVSFIKIILTCYKHYIISSFCRTYRYKHQYKIRRMILCYVQLNCISFMDASVFSPLFPSYTVEQLLNVKRLLNEQTKKTV